jgi:hypothetical protein
VCRPGSPARADRHDRVVPDALAFINYLDRQMTRSTLTSILDMATAERGSRSLGETIMQLMIYAQQSEANRIALDATEQIVIPLVDANWGEDEPAPQIVVTEVGVDDQLTAQDMNATCSSTAASPRRHARGRHPQAQEPPARSTTRRAASRSPPRARDPETTQGDPNA